MSCQSKNTCLFKLGNIFNVGASGASTIGAQVGDLTIKTPPSRNVFKTALKHLLMTPPSPPRIPQITFLFEGYLKRGKNLPPSAVLKNVFKKIIDQSLHQEKFLQPAATSKFFNIVYTWSKL